MGFYWLVKPLIVYAFLRAVFEWVMVLGAFVVVAYVGFRVARTRRKRSGN